MSCEYCSNPMFPNKPIFDRDEASVVLEGDYLRFDGCNGSQSYMRANYCFNCGAIIDRKAEYEAKEAEWEKEHGKA